MTAGVLSLERIESGVLSPFVGVAIDKLGPRKVMLGGMFITGLGFICLSRVNSLWQYYGAFALITCGVSFTTILALSTTLANWFESHRGRAIAVMSSGSGIGALLVPLIIWLISASDWRTGLMLIGIGFWIVAIPVSMVMRTRPEDYGYLPDGIPVKTNVQVEIPRSGSLAPQESQEIKSELASAQQRQNDFTVREALATRAFWQVSLAVGGGQLIMSAAVHQIPAMTTFGVSREMAGIVMMGVGLMSLVGRVGGGFMGDLMDKRKILTAAFAFEFLGILIFSNTKAAWHLLGFIFFWGMGSGASVPVRFAMLADYFGTRRFGSIVGAMMAVSTIFGIVGPIFVGWMFDVRGNYRDPYLILSLAALVSVPLMMTVEQPVKIRGSQT